MHDDQNKKKEKESLRTLDIACSKRKKRMHTVSVILFVRIFVVPIFEPPGRISIKFGIIGLH
jgi:hypothetical protein